MPVNPSRETWREAAFLAAATGLVEQRMERACIVVRDNVRVLVNRGNPTGRNPSLPGEPPKKVSGRFFRSLAYVVTRDSDGSVLGLIGSDVPYQPRLELGFVGTDSKGRTYHQAPRPSFRPALAISTPAIRKIFGIT